MLLHQHAIETLGIGAEGVGGRDGGVGGGDRCAEVQPVGLDQVGLVLELMRLAGDGAPSEVDQIS